MPLSHVHTEIIGTIDGGQTWSFSVDWLPAATAVITPAALQTWVNFVYSDFVAQVINGSPTPLGNKFSTAVKVIGAKAYFYNGTSPTAVYVAQSTGAVTSCTGTRLMPNQVAVCVTKLSTFSGKTRRGRLYLPLLAIEMGSDNHFSTPSPTTIATCIANWLSAVRLRPLGGANPSPQILGGNGTALYDLVSVRCDNVADTIRARRDKTIATATATSALVVP